MSACMNSRAKAAIHRPASEQDGRELQWKTAFLEALVNSSIDGILVVDREKQKLLHNQRFVDIFKIPARIAAEKDNGNRLRWVADMTTNPERYIKSVNHLYAHPEEIRHDEIDLKDGTVLDRYSSPVIGENGTYYGRIWSYRDISGRKRAEQQLRVQTTALDAAANAIVITDSIGTIQSVNAAFTALTGYSAQEAVGQNPRVLKSGSQDEAFYRRLWQTISSGQVWSGELTNRRKDGSFYVEEMTITPLRDAAGGIARYIAIKQDVTERKRAGEALRQSEEQFRAIFDLASVGIAQADPRTKKWVRVNKKMCDITGYSAEEMLQMHIADITCPEDRQPDREAFERVVRGEASDYRMEKRYVRKDGALTWVNVNMTIIRDASGQPARTVAAIEDITERKRLEARMERLRTEYALILNSIGEGVHWVDLDGRIKFENPAAAKMLGYEVSELIGKPAHSTMHHTRADGAAYPQSECCIYATLRDGALRRVTDEVFWRKDGTSFAVEYFCAPVCDQNGRSRGCVVIFADITERKRLEAQLFQSQKMETVGRLAGGIAHEFNSLMTAIIGQSELLLEDLPPGNPLSHNAVQIRAAADCAAALTRQLLAFGRKQIFQPEVLDLNRVLAGMDSMLRQLLGDGVTVRSVPAAGLKAVRADAGQIEQVIVNLAINARDAMPNGGTLVLETSNLTVRQDSPGRDPELKPGDYVMLAITDTGVGMSEEAMKRAFEPFFTTKGIGNGTGLGLAACHGIIKQSGGHISIDSKVGKGTTFKIFLPQVEPLPAIPIQGSGPIDAPRGTETILLAEDDPALREMAAALLRRLGYTVLISVGGMAELCADGDIDLLVTDDIMPDMSGRDLAGRLRALHPRIRVLLTPILNGKPIPGQSVMKQGVARLQKPFTPSALARKVRQLLDQPAPP